MARSGYAGTSTRQIAEEVGLTQSTLYHYFGSKREILSTLWMDILDAPLNLVARLLEADAQPIARLHGLVWFDVTQMQESQYNYGSLYLLPEIRRPEFAHIANARTTLREFYARLAGRALEDGKSPKYLGLVHLPYMMVESIVFARANEQELGFTGRELADAAVRAIGLRPLSRSEVSTSKDIVDAASVELRRMRAPALQTRPPQ
jgi:AcrR family transcriptional regulator